MGSRAAVNHFCQYVDKQDRNTYLWYEIKPTTSQFSFANSQTSKRTEKLVVYMNDYYSLSLSPGNASITCDPLGIYHLPLDTSRSSPPCVGSRNNGRVHVWCGVSGFRSCVSASLLKKCIMIAAIMHKKKLLPILSLMVMHLQ